VNGLTVPALGAVMAADEDAVTIIAETDSEMLLVDVNLA
jgi:hypothetical protein